MTTSPTQGSSLPAGTIAVQGTSSDNTGGSGVRDVQTKINISGTYTLATPGAPGNWSTWSNSHTITTAGSYKVIAKATDNAGNSRNYTVNITITSGSDTTPPSQVTGLTASPVSSSQINLSWTANPTADGVANYNVYRGTTAGFVVTPGTTTPIANTNYHHLFKHRSKASTTYYYKLACS